MALTREEQDALSRFIRDREAYDALPGVLERNKSIAKDRGMYDMMQSLDVDRSRAIAHGGLHGRPNSPQENTILQQAMDIEKKRKADLLASAIDSPKTDMLRNANAVPTPTATPPTQTRYGQSARTTERAVPEFMKNVIDPAMRGIGDAVGPALASGARGVGNYLAGIGEAFMYGTQGLSVPQARYMNQLAATQKAHQQMTQLQIGEQMRQQRATENIQPFQQKLKLAKPGFNNWFKNTIKVENPLAEPTYEMFKRYIGEYYNPMNRNQQVQFSPADDDTYYMTDQGGMSMLDLNILPAKHVLESRMNAQKLHQEQLAKRVNNIQMQYLMDTSAQGPMPAQSPYGQPQIMSPHGQQIAHAAGFNPLQLEHDYRRGAISPGLTPNIEERLTRANMAITEQMGTPGDMASVQNMDEAITAVEDSFGVEKGTIARPKNPMRREVFDNMLKNVTSGLSTVEKDKERGKRQQAYIDNQEKMLRLGSTLKSDVMETGKKIELQNTMAIKNLMFEHQKTLEVGKADARLTQMERKAKVDLNNRLAVLEKQQGFQGQQNQLTRDAARIRQVMSGQQAIDLETLRASNRVALQGRDNVIDSNKILTDFYTDLMRSNPAIAGQFAEILSQYDTATLNPKTSDAMRDALQKRLDEVVNSQIAENALQTIVNTEVFGDKPEERMSSLYEHIQRFNKLGIDTTRMQDQLTYMEGLEIQKTEDVTKVKVEGEREDIATLRGFLGDVDVIARNFDPGYVGMVDNLLAMGLGKINLTSPDEQRFRSATLDMRARVARARAGGAITATEESLLLAAVPDLGNGETKFLEDLANFQRLTRDMLRERYSLLGITPKDVYDEYAKQGLHPAVINEKMVSQGLLKPLKKEKKE